MDKTVEYPNIRFLLYAAIIWLLSAVVLVVIAALIATLTNISITAVGYISSGLSFACAFFAGIKAMRERGRGAVITGMVAGVAITTLALTLGFIISAEAIQADGVLSVVTFTLAGALAGSVFCPAKKSKQNSPRRRK